MIDTVKPALIKGICIYVLYKLQCHYYIDACVIMRFPSEIIKNNISPN